MSRAECAQAWASRRFQGLTPRDLEGALCVYALCNIMAPPTFEEVWRLFPDDVSEDQPLLSPDECDTVNTILVLADPTEAAQLELFEAFVRKVDEMGHDAPPIIWMPHTVAPEVRSSCGDEEVFVKMCRVGVDGLVIGEPEGFELALQTRTALHRSVSMNRSLASMVSEQRYRKVYSTWIHNCTQAIVWDYFRLKVAPSVPQVDSAIPQGELTSLDGFEFRQLLGMGSYSKVYRLARDGSLCDEVIKVVDKSGFIEVDDLKRARRLLNVLRLVSSDQWRHPNIVQFHEVYHSNSHLYFRMEFGGSETLQRHLARRQRQGAGSRPMSDVMVLSIMKQAVAAVAHLHGGPRVSHRDLHPGNFLLQESDNGVVLKLTDFAQSVQFREGASRSRGLCGTFPFVGPEVLLFPDYDALDADIWSLAVLLLELLCGLRSLERGLGVERSAEPSYEAMQHLLDSLTAEGTVAQLLASLLRPELRGWRTPLQQPLVGMFQVEGNRWSAQQVSEFLAQIGT